MLVNPRTNRRVVYESILERDLAYILMADSRVRSLYDQPPAVTYVDHSGKQRRHTFDFFVVLQDGTRCAIAVKPEKRADAMKDTLRLIRRQNRGYADTYVVRTEEHITRVRADNARKIVLALRTSHEHAVRAVEATAQQLRGVTDIKSLLDASGLCGPTGLDAALCLIAQGVLDVVSNGALTKDSKVRQGGSASQ